MTCTCDYNLLRKGLADEQCEECYQAFVDKEQKYHKMLEGVKELKTWVDVSQVSGVKVNTERFEHLFGGIINDLE